MSHIIINTIISGITSFWKKPTPAPTQTSSLHPIPPAPTLMDLAITALEKRFDTIGQPNQPAPSYREWQSLSWFVDIAKTEPIAQTIQGIEAAVLKDKPEGVTPESFLQANVMKMFQALKKAYPVPFTDLAQVPAWEDEALKKIYDWLVKKHPAIFPRLNTVTEVKKWLNDSNNRSAIESVTEIEICGKGINAIPSQLLKFSNLQALRLMNGGISFIPEWVGNLKNLRVLNFAENRIREIPHSLGNLENLELLILRYNEIVAIPDCLGRLTKLKSLSLEDNQIRTIPVLNKLTALRHFNLCNNQIEEFPEWISSLPNFSSTSTTGGWLGLQHNKIWEIPSTIPMNRRVQISLEYNDIITRLDGWGSKHGISFYGNPIITYKYSFAFGGTMVPVVTYPDKEETQH